MLNLSAAQASSRKSKCVSAKLASLSLDTSHFDKNLPRVMRVKASMAIAGKRRIKRRRGHQSPPVSPQQELATSPTGHVALGPWTGPYHMHPLSASSGSGELSVTLFVDELGSSHFTLEDDTDDIAPLSDLGDFDSNTKYIVATSSLTVPDFTSAFAQPPAVISVQYELSPTERQLVRRMVEETAQLRVAMWPSVPPRKVSRLPSYERGASHGVFGHTKSLYTVQQPRGRSA